MLNIDQSTVLSITTDGHSLMITPITREERIKAAMNNAKTDHAKRFKKRAE